MKNVIMDDAYDARPDIGATSFTKYFPEKNWGQVPQKNALIHCTMNWPVICVG